MRKFVDVRTVSAANFQRTAVICGIFIDVNISIFYILNQILIFCHVSNILYSNLTICHVSYAEMKYVKSLQSQDCSQQNV